MGGFKDSVIKNVALQLVNSLDKKIDGKEVVEEIKGLLTAKGAPASAVAAVAEGPLLNITFEMQEGLCEDKKKLADEYRRRANLLAPTSTGNLK